MKSIFPGLLRAGTCTVLLLVCTTLSEFSRAGTGSDLPAVPTASRTSTFPDSATLTRLLDSLIIPGLQKHHIPGMVVSIVYDSNIVVSRGYGYADLERKIPFDPDSTVIRIASISKLFTGTAVMQMVENGELDMNQDINSYLTHFKVEPWPGKPITLHHLLTHTAGFDDRYVGKSARTQESQVPLGEFLARRLPRRICPPGAVYTYSNFSNALAGFVVEEVAHEDFAAYVRRNILEPLGMHHSDYRLRPDLSPLLAVCYSHRGPGYQQNAFDFINDYPGGQMLSTGTDLAKFMIAHLHLGAYNGRRILSEESARTMQSPQFANHRMLNHAVGYSFGIDNATGVVILQHDGGYTGVGSRLCLCPDRKVGFFMACNIMDGSLIDEVTSLLRDELLPALPPDTTSYPLVPIPPHDKRIADFVGTYRSSRYAHNSFEMGGLLAGLGGFEMAIGGNEEGMVLMNTFAGKPRRMVQVEPCLFQSIDDKYMCAFRRDESGKVTHLFTNGTASFERVSWYETIPFQRWLLLVCVVVFATFSIVLPIARRIRKKGEPSRLAVNPAAWLARATASTFLIYLLGLGIVMGLVIPPEELAVGFAHGMPWAMYVVQSIAIIGTLILAGLIGWLFWRYIVGTEEKEHKSVGAWLPGTIMAITGLAFVWFLHYWNLLGYRF